MTFYDLCVDILAIAGGSVATIGVINTLYHYLFNKISGWIYRWMIIMWMSIIFILSNSIYINFICLKLW